MPIQSVNPANGQVLRGFEPLSEEAVHGKLALAQEAFSSYKDVPLESRAMWMKKLAGILEHESAELGTLITLEMGKTLSASRLEVLKCARACHFYAENASRILAEELIPTEGQNSYVRFDPLGVVLAVMPWNFPFWQVFRFIAPALMAGNVALLKHSSNVPQCALAIESLVRRAGFPKGIMQTLLIESWQVEPVLADVRVAAVTVTGSETAGRAVAAQAGWLIKKSVLELGGSDPFVVMPSADIVLAVEMGVRSRMVNSGQSCIAAKRFVVHERIYQEFESRFAEAMENLKIGDPMKEETEVGPLATAQQVIDLEEQVKAMKLAGGRVLTGGERMLGDGNFFEPTVVVGVPRSAAVCREEVFGPVAMLFRVKSLEEAIELANDTPFGLGASVWTRDVEEQARLVAELECGAVFVNAMVASDPRLPFGGVKKSGYGRELSWSGMREFMNVKTVVVADEVQQVQIPFEAEESAEESAEPVELKTMMTQEAYEPGQFSEAFEAALHRMGIPPAQ